MGISVLMSLYGKEHPEYLKLALESILMQTRQCDELILIKDGPLTSELDAVFNTWRETAEQLFLVTVYQFPNQVQLGRALAKGVLLCRQEYIARMDTDDIAVPERLALQEAYFKLHPETAVVGGMIEEFLPGGKKRVKIMPESHNEIVRYGKYRNPMNHMTVMFRKEAVLQSGNYRHFPLLEDYDLWSRMLACGAIFHNLPQILMHVRTGKELYQRRGGFSYFLSHKELRKLQLQLGLVNQTEYLCSLAASFGFAMQPSWMRAWLYQWCLRK